MERLCTTAQYFNCEPGKGQEEKEKEREEQQNQLNHSDVRAHTAATTDLSGSIKKI